MSRRVKFEITNDCTHTWTLTGGCSNQLEFDVSQMIGFITGDVYAGPYEVTPHVDAQYLPTQRKLMSDDVTIRAIPYYETSNVSGVTVYIADEL